MSRQIETQPPGLSGYRYEPRPIRFIGVSTTPAGWSVKNYAITVAGHHDALPVHSATHNSHGVAILTMHLGLQGFWVLIDWWAYGDVLMHRHLRAPVDNFTDLQDAAAEGFGPCVWELAVQAHERRAWLQHVLANPQGSDLGKYRLPSGMFRPP